MEHVQDIEHGLRNVVAKRHSPAVTEFIVLRRPNVKYNSGARKASIACLVRPLGVSLEEVAFELRSAR